MSNGFTKTARYYDKIYSWKDYQGESEQLISLIRRKLPEAQTLLDVACGSGMHIIYLKEQLQVLGVDIDPEMISIAAQRNPEIEFLQADMLDFNLGREFDVVTCLFSSIGYVKTLDNLRKAVQCLASHTRPGGLLIIEPWFTPDKWVPNTVHALFIDEPLLKIARINTSFVEGRLSIFDLHHLIGTPQGTEHVVEHHELGLFETDEMRTVMEDAGMAVEHEPRGLEGRGLFIGRRQG